MMTKIYYISYLRNSLVSFILLCQRHIFGHSMFKIGDLVQYHTKMNSLGIILEIDNGYNTFKVFWLCCLNKELRCKRAEYPQGDIIHI